MGWLTRPRRRRSPSQGGGGQEGKHKDLAASKGLSEDTEPHLQQLQEGSNQHSRDCSFHNFGGARDDGLTDRDATRNRKAIQLGHKDEANEERWALQLAKARDQEELGEKHRVEKVADYLPSEPSPAKTDVERIAEGDDSMQTEEDGPLTGAKGQQGRKRQLAGQSKEEGEGEADRKKRFPSGQEHGQGRLRTEAEVRRSMQVGMKMAAAERRGVHDPARMRKEVSTWSPWRARKRREDPTPAMGDEKPDGAGGSNGPITTTAPKGGLSATNEVEDKEAIKEGTGGVQTRKRGLEGEGLAAQLTPSKDRRNKEGQDRPDRSDAGDNNVPAEGKDERKNRMLELFHKVKQDAGGEGAWTTSREEHATDQIVFTATSAATATTPTAAGASGDGKDGTPLVQGCTEFAPNHLITPILPRSGGADVR